MAGRILKMSTIVRIIYSNSSQVELVVVVVIIGRSTSGQNIFKSTFMFQR
jgi:hypothetical protein